MKFSIYLESEMTNYTTELVVNEVLLALDSNFPLDVERAVRKIQPLCVKDSVSDIQIREELISVAVQRGAGIILDRVR
jgi:hypothetical protein